MGASPPPSSPFLIINYNLTAIASITVTINGVGVNTFSTDTSARTITLANGATAGEVIGVQLYDSGETGGRSLFDPFNLAYTHAYLLQKSGVGGIAHYDFFSQ